MPTLHWIGKEKVINHHLDVPYRVLEHQYGFETANGKSDQPTNSGNKIIHGDNLEALKSLLPEYEGKVKCIYIDPPYNTGNEGWVYNDNVNDPKIKKWLEATLEGKEVTRDDLTRHDKWLCMMYPRLRLLQKLLSTDGLLFVSLDDNEIGNCILLLDEIFGSKNRLACAPWLAEPSGGKEKTTLRNGHEYLLIYHNGSTQSLSKEERSSGALNMKDAKGAYRKGRELRKWGGTSLREDREGQWYGLKTPSGDLVFPFRNDGREGHWRWGKEQKMKPIILDPSVAHWEKCDYDPGVVVNGETSRWVPFEKIRDVKKSVGWATWLDKVGYNSDGTSVLKAIFGEKIFDTPKPVSLIEWCISLHDDENAIVIDSFAGSATTAHAVLNLNQLDDGNRQFILIEMEEFSDTITAERVKRVMQGYGEGNNAVEGTGGAFDYYTLGRALFDEEGNLNEAVGADKIRAYVWYTETRSAFQATDDSEPYLLGKRDETAYYFIYEPARRTTLDYESLSQIKTPAGNYVIYADNCLLTKDYLIQHNIVFKKIPRDISRF